MKMTRCAELCCNSVTASVLHRRDLSPRWLERDKAQKAYAGPTHGGHSYEVVDESSKHLRYLQMNDMSSPLCCLGDTVFPRK